MAYLVESLPKSCFFCDCCHKRYYSTGYIEQFCGIEDMAVGCHYDHNKCNNVGRPKWCPLKEIPEAEHYPSYNKGWNDCLNKMTSLLKTEF